MPQLPIMMYRLRGDTEKILQTRFETFKESKTEKDNMV